MTDDKEVVKSLDKISEKLGAINNTIKDIHAELKETKQNQMVEEKLSENDIKWMMERQVDSYLAWIGLWLVCLLGNATILTNVIISDAVPIDKPYLLLVIYLALIMGMVFSVCRLGFIIRDHIRLARQIQDTALHGYIFKHRGRVSKFAVNDEGELHHLNLIILCVFHCVVFLLLFYFALF